MPTRKAMRYIIMNTYPICDSPNQRFYLRTEALFGVVLVPAQKLSSRK